MLPDIIMAKKRNGVKSVIRSAIVVSVKAKSFTYLVLSGLMKTYAEHIAEATAFWQGQIKTFLEAEGTTVPSDEEIKKAFESALQTGQMDVFIAQYGLDQADKLQGAVKRAAKMGEAL